MTLVKKMVAYLKSLEDLLLNLGGREPMVLYLTYLFLLRKLPLDGMKLPLLMKKLKILLDLMMLSIELMKILKELKKN